MPYWPADTPPSVPEQMPQAVTPGPAPVPYAGPGFAIAPDMLAPVPDVAPGVSAGAGVLIGVTGANDVSEAPWAAPNVNPYAAGGIKKIYTGGDDNPAGLDDVATTVAASVAAAEARFGAHQLDTYGQGSQIGDLMPLPAETSAGKVSEGGGYYDPPRDYDGGQL